MRDLWSARRSREDSARLLRLAGARRKRPPTRGWSGCLLVRGRGALERFLGGLVFSDMLVEVPQRELRAMDFGFAHRRGECVLRFLLVSTCKLKCAEVHARAFALGTGGDSPLGNLHRAGKVAKTGDGIAEENEGFEV